MTTLVQGLPNISFTENLPEIIITGITESVFLTVQVGENRYATDFRLSPNSGKIIIYTRQMVRALQPVASPSEPTVRSLPLLSITIKTGVGTIKQNCYLIPGGSGLINDSLTEWLSQNFLTWQPQIMTTTPDQPQWLAFVGTTLYQSIEVWSTLYTRDGRKRTKVIEIVQDLLPRFHQIPTDFITLWQKECLANNLTPYCYDVFGIGRRRVQTSDTQPGIILPPDNNRPYPQRYVLRSPRYNDICFGFENTLGGFDTLIVEGKQSYQPEGEVSTFRSNEREIELVNDYRSQWEANTGLIESERTSNQFQDFFKSTNRWVLREGRWCRIVIVEYKVKHYRGEANGYTFKYRLADKEESRYFDRVELPTVDPPLDVF